MGWIKSPLVGLAVVVLAGGCRPMIVAPEVPTLSMKPEVVGVVESVHDAGCAASRVTLESGMTLELILSSTDESAPVSLCSRSTRPLAWQAIGEWSLPILEAGDLAFFGHDPHGRQWWGRARPVDTSLTEGRACFGTPEGAYEEGSTFHLSRGVVLATSPAFELPGNWLRPLVVGSGYGLCLDRDGRVVGIYYYASRTY